MQRQELGCMDLGPKAIILRNDEELLVINKRAGLLSFPDGYDP